MVQSRSLLHADIFSHTLNGTPWINFEWLSQLVLFAIYSAGGFWGLYAAKVALCAAIIAVVVLLIRRAGGAGAYLFLLSWAAFKTIQPRLQDRPELISLLFLGLLVWFILRVRAGTESAAKRAPLLIFVLMLIWVNAHGGFIYGLALVLMFYAGARWANEPAWVQAFLLKAAAAATTALLFNPYGVKLGLVFWEHARQLKGENLIQEWQRAGVRDVPFFWALYVAAAVAIARGILRRSQETRFWTPAVILFALWGTLYYRNAALLAFVAAPFLASTLRDNDGKKIVWAAAIALMLLDARVLARPLPPQPVAWIKFPVGACEYVRDNNLQGVMFNTYDAGGYIGWALGPERKLYMDGRYIFYPLLQEFDRRRHEPAFLVEKKIDYAIINFEANPLLLAVYEPLFPPDKWHAAFRDEAAVVYVKLTKPHRG